MTWAWTSSTLLVVILCHVTQPRHACSFSSRTAATVGHKLLCAQVLMSLAWWATYKRQYITWYPPTMSILTLSTPIWSIPTMSIFHYINFPLHQFPTTSTSHYNNFPLHQFPLHWFPTTWIPAMSIPILSMLIKWTNWEIDLVWNWQSCNWLIGK